MLCETLLDGEVGGEQIVEGLFNATQLFLFPLRLFRLGVGRGGGDSKKTAVRLIPVKVASPSSSIQVRVDVDRKVP